MRLTLTVPPRPDPSTSGAGAQAAVLDYGAPAHQSLGIDRFARPLPPNNPAISAELVRLGLLPTTPSASAEGRAVADALLEAFGDDRWSTLNDSAVLARLQAARPPRGARGERRPRYAAMAAGGVLECVMALGFDDAADGVAPPAPSGAVSVSDRVAELSDALRARGYCEGRSSAAPLLATIDRPCADDAATSYFTRADGVRLAPLAASESTRGIVVRLVANVDGRSGDVAAGAFLDGLRHAAVCLYVGHWRYGVGPDFDRALALEVADDAGLPADPHGLARAAKIESARRAESFEAVLDHWLDQRRIAIARAGAARVRFGSNNLVPRSPTARLAHWIACRVEDERLSDVQAIAGSAVGPRHRLWILISCRSAMAFPAIRDALPASAVRLVGLRAMSSLGNWRTLPWMLDAVRAGAPWSELIGAMDPCGDPGGVVIDGWQEDPRIP